MTAATRRRQAGTGTGTETETETDRLANKSSNFTIDVIAIKASIYEW